MDFSLLQKLTGIAGAPSREEKVRTFVEQEFLNLGLKCHTDHLGNLIGHISPSQPQPHEGDKATQKNLWKVVLDAHMDEVAMMVQYVNERGFIRFIPLGGIDANCLYAQPVQIHGKEVVAGVIGSVAPHLKANDKSAFHVSLDDLFIDTGLPAIEVQRLISVGDIVTFQPFWHENDHIIQAKALDDRVGLFVMIEALKASITKLDCELFVVASVQEEMGLKGAQAVAKAIEPDIVVALEGTVANDLPNVAPHLRLAQLGFGVEIRLSDSRFLADRRLCDFLRELALKNGISHQLIVKKFGGTNAAAFQVEGRGARTGALSVPVRYIHSPVGIARKADIQAAIQLVTAFIQNTGKA